MKNPDYHPDKAHLPSAADMQRWKHGGRAKHLEAERRLQATAARLRKRYPEVYDSKS